MKVTMLTHTPEPEKLIAMAAKLCYSSTDVATLEQGLTDEKIKSFLDMLMSIGHESPLEHVTFTFAIEGISRSCSHQLVRHRIASYSQQSQRYVTMNNFKYVIPPNITECGLEEDYVAMMNDLRDKYEYIQKKLTEKLVEKEGNHDNKTIKKCEKIANEDARFILPNACETSIIVTMNIRSLYNFFEHRMCNRAQWEIRELAWEMWKQCIEVSPTLFKHAGPPCTHGGCPEGKMSCGQVFEIREIHSDLFNKFTTK